MEVTDGDAKVQDGGSRFGVKGANEISEGLSAVYRFEHRLNSTNASLIHSFDPKTPTAGSGRLSYVGLSGGFGTISVGQIWNAAFNHVGVITDPSWFYGNSETGYRHGSAVSYSVSSGTMSMQLDAVMENKGEDDTNDVDKIEFGISMNVGDIGTIAFAHRDNADKDASNYLAVSTDIAGISAHLGLAQHKDDMATFVIEVEAKDAVLPNKNKGIKAAKAVEAADAGETERPLESSTLFAGVGGSLGDTGVSYLLQVRSKEVESVGATDGDGGAEIVITKSNPWLVNVTKSMGGGSLLILEHGNSDAGGGSSTMLALKVDF